MQHGRFTYCFLQLITQVPRPWSRKPVHRAELPQNRSCCEQIALQIWTTLFFSLLTTIFIKSETKRTKHEKPPGSSQNLPKPLERPVTQGLVVSKAQDPLAETLSYCLGFKSLGFASGCGNGSGGGGGGSRSRRRRSSSSSNVVVVVGGSCWLLVSGAGVFFLLEFGIDNALGGWKVCCGLEMVDLFSDFHVCCLLCRDWKVFPCAMWEAFACVCTRGVCVVFSMTTAMHLSRPSELQVLWKVLAKHTSAFQIWLPTGSLETSDLLHDLLVSRHDLQVIGSFLKFKV